MDSNSPLLVFVQLGANPSPTLLHFARIAQSRLNLARMVLVTNHPKIWSAFPGEVIEYSLAHRNPAISRLIRRFPERNQISGGYWIHTLERIFALEILGHFYPNSSPILHIESDCYSLIDDQILSELQRRCNHFSVPRYSDTQGIASIVFSPSVFDLISTLKIFEQIIDDSKSWIGDMNLLGLALNANLINELPTHLSDAWDVSHLSKTGSYEKLIFDGLAIGQYLLGQDAYHTNGFAIPGHVNEFFRDPIKEWSWKIKYNNLESVGDLFAESQNTDYRVANIHVHSKIHLTPMNYNDPMWKSVLNTANGIMDPTPIEMPENTIHTEKISCLNRFRFERRKGWIHLSRQIVRKIFR